MGGIPVDAVRFYADLESDNSREFWAANKQRYDESVRAPFEALLDSLAGEFGPGKVFRPYRDVRFSPDKRPYKEYQGGFVQTADGMGWYVQLSAAGLMTGGGFHHHAPDQVTRFRAAVDASGTGEELAGIVDALEEAKFEVGGEQLKTRPRGYADDHPRLDLLRHKSLTVGREHGVPSWLSTARVVTKVRDDWRRIRPLIEWLRANVGPTGEPTRRR
jgi:uncharacterized protein (TIGR02453 family)